MKALIILAMLSATSVSAAQPWAVYTHDLGNEAYVDHGELRGVLHGGKRAFYLELVRAVLAEMRESTHIENLPLARALMTLETRSRVAVFNVDRTAARQSRMQWVGPIAQETDYLYESVSDRTGIKTWDDAKNMPVCTLNGNVHDELLRQYGFTQINRNESYVGCFRMLMAGHVRLVASADFGLKEKLLAAQIDPNTVVATPVKLGVEQGFIALSLDTAAPEIHRWTAALARIRESGQYDTLYQAYAH